MSRFRKAKANSDLLGGQKPILPKRKKTMLLKTFAKGALLFLSLIGASFVGYFAYQHRGSIHAFFTSKSPVTWQVAFHPHSLRVINEKLRESIATDVKKLVPYDEKDLLAQAARQLQKKHGAKQVHILRTGANTLNIMMSFREPILRVEAGHERLVSVEGEVYGPDGRINQPLPLLKGVFSTSAKFTYNERGVIELGAEEEAVVKGALHLLKHLQDRRIKVAALTHSKYRGFTVDLEGTPLQVALGKEPFEKKISRLSEILLKLKDKGQTASRIELDYEGKAFIREKKL